MAAAKFDELMMQIDVVGVGLDAQASLPPKLLKRVAQAHILVAGKRLIQQFPHHGGERWLLDDLSLTLQRIKNALQTKPNCSIVILVTGDPLFFGFGRLILACFPPERVSFWPSVSSVQLAFSRIKIPWQDATLMSVHGRDFDALMTAVRQGDEKIAVLTDPVHSPSAIADLIVALDLPITYDAWVCENLGGEQERVQRLSLSEVREQTFASLTVLILIRRSQHLLALDRLPIMGIPDACFYTFRDRPGLMTKREIRLLALGELALTSSAICWDIGAGTGSMSIEMARLSSTGMIYAVEKSAAGIQLIDQNKNHFGIENICVTQGAAPEAIQKWPDPDRVFIGGSGQRLPDILTLCQKRLKTHGVLVLAIATLENLHQAFSWLQQHHWQVHVLHTQLSRSLPIATLTRLHPLNPVYLLTATRKI